MLTMLSAWVLRHSWREIAAALAVLALGIASAWFIVHERHVGRDECEAAHARADAIAQTAADKVSIKANTELHADLEEISQPLPGYLQVYGDKSKPSDCPSVPYKRKLKE